MANISLKELDVENFKGINKFSLKPDGQNCLVRADNGKGKTTIMDAFLWLLFDKDSRGNSQFSIKPLTKEGKQVHNLEQSVHGVLDISGESLSLKKVFKEKYTKKRGSRISEFTGHTTDYYINEVPIQKKEWDKHIEAIIDEETFRLLTSSTHFNDLHWEKRRQILLDVCGDVSDGDVLESMFPAIKDKDLYADLANILNQHSLDDHKKIVAAQKTKVNNRLKEIPARIDELNKSLTGVSDVDVKACEKRISELDKKIEAMKDNSELSGLRKQKAELEATLAEKNTEIDRAHRANTKDLDDQIADLKRSQQGMETNLHGLSASIKTGSDLFMNNEVLMKDLRDTYQQIAEQEPNVKDCCPTCGQALPEEEVAAAVTKFNEDKAAQLAEINKDGKIAKAENEETAKKTEICETEKKKLETDLKAIDKEMEGILKERPDEPPVTKEMVNLQTEIDEFAVRIVEYAMPDPSDLERDRRMEQAKIAEVKAAKKTGIRIEELGEEEKKLATEYEDLEKQTFLIEKFIVQKVGLLENGINSKFGIARFKLFDDQINGGVKETCVTLYEGVPFGDSLNTGAEINVGIDIIKTLSEHYGIKAPVFIDHAESVTELLDPGMQTIKLMVSKDHPELEANYG